MNTNATIEYIRAKENICPSTVWEFSVLDRACFSMVIRGTWIFDLQLDVNVMKAGLKKLLNYTPKVSLKEGLSELIEDVKKHPEDY